MFEWPRLPPLPPSLGPFITPMFKILLRPKPNLLCRGGSTAEIGAEKWGTNGEVPFSCSQPLDIKGVKNGGGGNRTRVPRCFRQGFYACSQVTLQISSPQHRDRKSVV